MLGSDGGAAREDTEAHHSCEGQGEVDSEGETNKDLSSCVADQRLKTSTRV